MATEKKFNLIVDCNTNEQTLVEYTAEEYAQAATDAATFLEQQALAQSEAAAKAEAKASAEAKLAAIGLTAEEIAALSA
jgi:hypothetical protein